MKNISFAILLIATTASAEEIKKPEKTTLLEVSSQDIQIIAAALNIAASSCSQQDAACVVGLNKSAILTKLQSAAATLKSEVTKK